MASTRHVRLLQRRRRKRIPALRLSIRQPRGIAGERRAGRLEHLTFGLEREAADQKHPAIALWHRYTLSPFRFLRGVAGRDSTMI